MIRYIFRCPLAASIVSALIGSFPAQAQSPFETREYLNQTGLGIIGAAEAYGLGYTGKGVTIGIVDSGISALHPEFFGKILGGYDFSLGQPVTQAEGMDSPTGHGSHVSGIMAARRDGRGMHGVAFDAQLFSVRMGYRPDDSDGDDGDGDGDDDGDSYKDTALYLNLMLPRAWGYMAKQNLVVINNSIGVNDCSETSSNPGSIPCHVEDFVKDEVGDFNVDRLFGDSVGALYELQEAGTLMVFATGNEKQEHPDLLAGMPHHYADLKPNWLAVTAVDVDTKELAVYANQCGVAAEWCLAAPGSVNEDMGIVSVYPEGNYVRQSGTSMAAPHVTGAVALVKEAFPFFNAYQLQQTILTTATDLTPLDEDRYDKVFGWGLLNVGKAVRGPALFVSTFDIDTMGYNATFSNDIGDLSTFAKGQGSLIKRGAGTLTLAGKNEYTGATTIKGGTLVVNGSLLPGTPTTVEQYGILGGSGYVGDLHNHGVVAPGNSVGTLTVAGDYTAYAGSILQLEVDAENRHDTLRVGGKATLGGTLALSGGPYRQGQTYNFLQAASTDGIFSKIDSSLLFLDPSLTAAGTGLSLSVARNGTAFATYTQTRNQQAVANGLDALSSAPPAAMASIYDDVLNATAGSMPGFMDQLSGEAHASVQSALLTQSDLWTSSVTRRLNGVMASPAGNTPLPMWVSLHRQWTTLDGSAGSADTRSYTNGLYLGGDASLGKGWHAGAAVGYQDGRVTTNDRDSRSDTNSYTAAIYAGKHWEMQHGHRLNWRVSGAYTHHDIDARRTISVGGQQTLNASYRAHQVSTFTELGYALAVNEQATVEPYGRLSWTQFHTSGFSETGGNAALRSSSKDGGIGSLTLGLRAAANIELKASTTARVAGELGWRHANGDLTPKREMAFAQVNDAQFTVAGAPLARNALLVGLNGEVNIGKKTAMGLSYNGQFGAGTSSNTGSLYLNIKF